LFSTSEFKTFFLFSEYEWKRLLFFSLMKNVLNFSFVFFLPIKTFYSYGNFQSTNKKT
jgi:hypothetical protein